MSQISPFNGLRFSQAAGTLENLVAPPYDVLSDEDRARYASKNPHNVVWLTVPEQLPDDRSKFVKYARASSRLAEWRREGILAKEKNATLYRYKQTFSLPGEIGRLTRTAAIALLKIEPYE